MLKNQRGAGGSSMIKTRYKEVPRIIEVQTLYCDDCDKVMILQPYVLTSYPVQYVYICPKCGQIINSTDRYDNPVCGEEEKWY